MTIAVYARCVKDNHPDYLKTLSTRLDHEGVQLIVHDSYFKFLKHDFQFNLDIPTFTSYADLKGKVDCVISLGGDGTILETLDLVRDSGIPILGVNTGRLGFLANVFKEDFAQAIQLLLHKKYKIEQRELLQLDSETKYFGELPFAVNEVTVIKKDTSAMITIDVAVNGIFLNSYWADGLIVSTPTGSTAYSLSCGGPILLPDSKNFVVTPIAPHNLNMRPVVLSSENILNLKVRGRASEYLVSLDSRSTTIQTDAEINIKKADFALNLINLEGQHFFSTLRSKLMWGADKRN